MAQAIPLSSLDTFNTIRASVTLLFDDTRIQVATVEYHHQPRVDAVTVLEQSEDNVKLIVRVSDFGNSARKSFSAG